MLQPSGILLSSGLHSNQNDPSLFSYASTKTYSAEGDRLTVHRLLHVHGYTREKIVFYIAHTFTYGLSAYAQKNYYYIISSQILPATFHKELSESISDIVSQLLLSYVCSRIHTTEESELRMPRNSHVIPRNRKTINT